MEFTARDVDGIKSEAEAKGMMAVDQNSAEGLMDDYVDILAEVTALCAVQDPVEKPYDSKYKARKLLDNLVNKLEATKTVSMMEGRRETVTEMKWRVAACQVKLGIISYEVEEPHNAQIDLELAASFYSPDFVQEISDIVGPDLGEGEDGAADSAGAPPAVVSLADPPDVCLPKNNLVICIDAMQCLNMMGILWAGRGAVQKSFLYLEAANRLYQKGQVHTSKLNAHSPATERRKAKDMESVYTHNLFYLAQAHGHVGDTQKSGLYCYMTLQRQLDSRFDGAAAALDWVKNCVGISDFYIALGHYKRCALALMTAEVVLTRHVLEVPVAGPATRPEESDAECDARAAAVEVAADLNRRLAHLDIIVLKRAYERRLVQGNCKEAGVSFEEPHADDADDEDDGVCAKATLKSDEAASSRSKDSEGSVAFEFFKGIAVGVVPYLCAGDICTFEQARCVFLRASVRLDAAKSFYLLDGFVSDHVALLQEQSKNYHYLAGFEADVKRQAAMETKRADLLSPLLQQLSAIAFEGLHKEVSYELGEVYMTLHDIKIEKIRSRRSDGVVSGDVVKKAELENSNTLCHKAVASFTHYLSFFAPAEDNTSRGVGDFVNMERGQMFAVATTKPNLAAISEQEVRSFLNSHFLICRMLSKMLIPSCSDPHQRSAYIVICLKRYEWLVKFTPMLCKSKNVPLGETFDEEHNICRDMAELLPSKINRIHHYGESPTL